MTAESKRKRCRPFKTAAAGLILTTGLSLALPGTVLTGSPASVSAAESSQKVTLRIANWEEYIDEGDWDEEEAIDLDDREGTTILGENSMVEDFEEWYRETYGVDVEVEYSTFGTNEDLYNQLTLGNSFDLVCPSEYMFMKLIAENRLQPLSESFFDEQDKNNFYIRGVSDYIRNIFDTNTINGEPWSKYAAGYMWGTTGIVYNPDVISKEEASHWAVLADPKYKGQVTIKDNVRDSYFAALGILNEKELLDPEFIQAPDRLERIAEVMNRTDEATVGKAETMLKQMKENAYSFESDSGKADMVIMRIMDIFLAIPGTLLAICIVASLGNSIPNLVIAQAIASTPTFARVVRGAVLTVRGADYVEAARAIGAKDATIIFHDVLPNSLAPIIVQTTLQVASVILSIAGLSFLGLGIPAPTPEWGAMLSAARSYIRDYSYMCMFPGCAIMITILALNLLGDGLRDALDPRLR